MGLRFNMRQDAFHFIWPTTSLKYNLCVLYLLLLSRNALFLLGQIIDMDRSASAVCNLPPWKPWPVSYKRGDLASMLVVLPVKGLAGRLCSVPRQASASLLEKHSWDRTGKGAVWASFPWPGSSFSIWRSQDMECVFRMHSSPHVARLRVSACVYPRGQFT